MIDIVILCVFAFAAGLIDAAVGGGGLIQIPALFNVLPTAQPAALLGTNKVASACGTAFAARSFVRKVVIDWGLVIPAACAAFVMAFFGAATVSFVPQSMIRPAVLVLIVLMAIYTFWKKRTSAPCTNPCASAPRKKTAGDRHRRCHWLLRRTVRSRYWQLPDLPVYPLLRLRLPSCLGVGQAGEHRDQRSGADILHSDG